MSFYKKLIKEVTECNDADAAKVEDGMRDMTITGTLDGLSHPQFVALAQEVYGEVAV